ncbi:MAG: SAM-dependent DNA methyltransferase [Spirochaetota bacterium]
MPSLPRDLRSKLESTVIAARKRAEAAALDELRRLGVDAGTVPAYLDAEGKELRRRLRAHGRQLGDALLAEPKDAQEVGRLALEIAYEHWHRMLFARFLAENSLLIHPEYRVALSLAECDELAHEAEKAGKPGTGRWDIAAGFASAMLPQIFRKDSPALAVAFPSNERAELERLLAALPTEIFLASDSLGWVYQFWQSEAKDQVNKSEKKIGADELPAVTQLFTEDYMVSFLLDNSLGAWWAGKRMGEEGVKGLRDQGEMGEEELRKRYALPGMPLAYLRFVKDEAGSWRPAAGIFEAWPKSAKELKYLDPCCGSGHFLTAGFQYLAVMRQAEEGLDARAAGDAVLRDNLFGLELDPRCVEIAAFSLAFEAWRSGGGYRELPELHVACSGAAPRISKKEWLRVADRAAGLLAGDEAGLFPDPNADSLWKSNLHDGLSALYELFEDAPVLGSLIDPRSVTSTLFRAGFDKTADLLAEALKKEKAQDESHEAGVVAQGIAKAASLLAGRYHIVATNVPYLGSGNQDEKLRDFCEEHYAEAKKDLATVFLDRCLEFCASGGTTSVVLPQNWLFLTSYRKLREKLLKRDVWNSLARLGPGAFETISREVVNVALVTISAGPERHKQRLQPLAPQEYFFAGLDVATPRELSEKAVLLRTGIVVFISQIKQLNNPDSRVLIGKESIFPLLMDFAETGTGLQTFDRPRFIYNYWELSTIADGWLPLQSTPSQNTFASGLSEIVLWENAEGKLFDVMRAKETIEGYKTGIWKAGSQYWGRKGALHGVMANLPMSAYLGYPYDTNAAVLLPRKPEYSLALWAYSESGKFADEVRNLDQKLMVTNATFLKVPFDHDYWTKVANERYPLGLPAPFSDDPTQWIFHGHPAGSVVWSDTEKRLTPGKLRIDATVLQVALARLLGYRWPAELNPAMELSAESRALVESCKALDRFADQDGIVCIPSVNREVPAADRLLELLAAAYGVEWSPHILPELLDSSDWAGRDLESWLRDAFFEQHCKIFQHRPFIWQITDGTKDGFSALVNYHRLDHALLEKLIYSTLGDWITRQESDERAKKPGATVRVNAAKALKEKLELILEGEASYDIFVRWKPLAEQPLGWNPDLNDGVRLNIRPFMTAGVLRHNKPPKLNVKWDKDRGKDVESAPWFKVFGGERINEHHTTLGEKRGARGGK